MLTCRRVLQFVMFITEQEASDTGHRVLRGPHIYGSLASATRGSNYLGSQDTDEMMILTL